MAQSLTHDVLILGAGLAGLRAAVELSHRTEGHIDIGIVSKVQLMRAHSVCAEGGTAAVLREDEGDSIALHAWDSVKGSDFLADQDVVWRFCKAMPREIQLLDHWGIPWTRDAQGRISQRPFGGHSYPRATLAADKTGLLRDADAVRPAAALPVLQALRRALHHRHPRRGGPVRGAAWASTRRAARPSCCRRKALLIASGGGGTLYGFTTYSETVTGDGMAMAYRAGLPLEDMEFLQFHPTGLVPSGILMTEGVPRRGRLPEEQQGRALHGAVRAEQDGAGAARHGVARRDDRDSRGPRVPGPRGQGLPAPRPDAPGRGHHQHAPAAHPRGLHQVRRHRPDRRSRSRSGPVAHYSMGGIETDINGLTRVTDIWAAGEAACVSLHGANRLGSNSTAECLVWGGITGEEIARALPVAAASRRACPSGAGLAQQARMKTIARRARARRTCTSCGASCGR